ncbi:unnamed protein product [Camellia sinensis]
MRRRTTTPPAIQMQVCHICTLSLCATMSPRSVHTEGEEQGCLSLVGPRKIFSELAFSKLVCSRTVIQHRYIEVSGLKLHVAEIGSGQSVVVFLHGFPEIWYSWRHQMIALSNAGYRAIAPDSRGYGLSDPPHVPENASYADIIDDLLAILDSLCIPKVFLVAKDFGTRTSFFFALLYPERVSGIITMGVPFVPPGPFEFGKNLPEGFYMSRWKGAEDYIRSGQVKVFVPDLEITYLPEGSHFVQEQLPDEVNQLVLTFLKKHSC